MGRKVFRRRGHLVWRVLEMFSQVCEALLNTSDPVLEPSHERLKTLVVGAPLLTAHLKFDEPVFQGIISVTRRVVTQARRLHSRSRLANLTAALYLSNLL